MAGSCDMVLADVQIEEFVELVKDIESVKVINHSGVSGSNTFTPPRGPDLALTNILHFKPRRLELVALALTRWAKYFASVRDGKRETYTRCVAWLVTHYAMGGQGRLDDISVAYVFRTKRIGDDKIEHKLRTCLEAGDGDDDDDSAPPTSHMVNEAAEHLIKIWDATGKRKDYRHHPSVCVEPGRQPQPARFRPVREFATVMSRAVELHQLYPIHKDRDCRMACIGEPSDDGVVAGILCRCRSRATDALTPKVLRYPLHVPTAVITSDYIFKAALELLLSPHIHWEWKTGLLRFWAVRGTKILSRYNTVKANPSLPYHPLVIVPCAANLWDFCRTDKPPSAVEFAIINDSPPSNPIVASGAGPWCMAHRSWLRSINHCPNTVCDEATNVIETILVPKLVSSTRAPPSMVDSLSTLPWRQNRGNVLMVNATMISDVGATAESQIIPSDHFIAALIRIILNSKEQYGHGHLIKDGDVDTGSSIVTVAFGCAPLIKGLASRSKLSCLLTTDRDLMGSISTQQLYASSVIRTRFPRLF